MALKSKWGLEILKQGSFKRLEMYLKCPIVGEIVEICRLQMARNALELSTMVGENFEICWLQMARNALKLSTMVGIFLKYAGFKWLETHLNCPPWL